MGTGTWRAFLLNFLALLTLPLNSEYEILGPWHLAKEIAFGSEALGVSSLSSCHILALRGLRFLLLLSPQLCRGKILLKLRGTDLEKPEHATHSWRKKKLQRSCRGMWYIKQVPFVYNAKDTGAGRGSELAPFIHNKKYLFTKMNCTFVRLVFGLMDSSWGLMHKRNRKLKNQKTEEMEELEEIA